MATIIKMKILLILTLILSDALQLFQKHKQHISILSVLKV